MKLFLIPWPYDYHQRGEVLIKASSAARANLMARAALLAKGWAHQYDTLKVDEVREFTERVYINEGCDC